MPGGNGTGPSGQGPVAGKGRGSWSGVGPGGKCVCPNCGTKMSHKAGVPCNFMECPKCGSKILRGKTI